MIEGKIPAFIDKKRNKVRDRCAGCLKTAFTKQGGCNSPLKRGGRGCVGGQEIWIRRLQNRYNPVNVIILKHTLAGGIKTTETRTESNLNEKEGPALTEGQTAIFGGTFNPIHFGHLRAAEEVREALGLSKVIFIPSCVPPLKSGDLAEVHCRLDMVRLAIRDNPYFELSDMECRRGEKSYTVKTLEELKEQHPSIEPFFILGVDAFLDMPNWYQPERLIQLCDFIVVNRPPFSIEEILRSPFLKDEGMRLSRETQALLSLKSGRKVISINCTSLGISASDIRERLKKGMSIKYLLPESVESYIISNKLYNNLQSERR